ncbi:hypothetical protein [Phycicoccus sp. 3266]|jgi:hypothetical protein|uniref:hypothetical protein n=1 Tax=Phycicoccus sp. 3266 TaxID=2817751 RepID=UPI00285BAF40|nr:hypothetical protein [Phycicoccus sp. 3266]MDR6862153.1 type VI protein secretion system component VasF [Phycicoccus sp. 3266]
MTVLAKALLRTQWALTDVVRRGERGDVPGWVMITLMTAGLVAVLWKVAGSELEAMFHRAMSNVTG